VEEFLNAHDETEICLIQNDYDDPFNDARVGFWGVSAWPTVVGNGLADVWPIDCIEGDYQANAAIPSPLDIQIVEDGMGTFTAHITAEQSVSGAWFFMVATLDEDVPGSNGPTHLPRHVKVHMTPPTAGDPFSINTGETISITHTFQVEPGWDYAQMGVAAWVTRPGGTNVSPCPFGNIANMNEVLQSRWVPVQGTVRVENTTWSEVKALYR
jgi:hypothetical protein